MSELVVSDFPGLSFAKRSAEPGGVTYADEAENVDTTGGTARPAKADSFIESGHSLEITKQSGTYYSGGTNYLQWIADEQDVLIYKKSGSWKQLINSVERDISLPSPTGPTLTNLSMSTPEAVTVQTVDDNVEFLEHKDYVYYITFSKIVDGQELESLPSVAISTPNYVPVYTASDGLRDYPGFGTFAVGDLYTNGEYIYRCKTGHVVAEGADPNFIVGNWDNLGAAAINHRHHIVPRPTTVPANATNWNVYRSDNGDTARLIISAAAIGAGEGFAQVTDKLVSSARGRNISSVNSELRFEYVLTWVRVTGGRTEESGPSSPTGLDVNTLGIKVTRPLSVPAGTTHWKVYRISTLYDATTAFQEVAEVAIAETYYDDFTSNASLGSVLPSRFTAADGTITVLEAPEVTFDGMAGPFSGYFVGWKDNALYLSQPGYVHLWSSAYSFYCNAPIVAVTQNGSELSVMTTKGVQRAYGSSPSRTALTQGTNGGGAVGRRTCVASEYGTMYLTKDGISAINGSQVRELSGILGSEYFKTLTPVQLEYHDNALYYFHSTGVLVYRFDEQKFSTRSTVYVSAYASKEDGEVYVLESTTIKQLNGSEDSLTQTYRTGEWVLSKPQHKKFRSLWFTGSGTITVTVYQDDTQLISRAVNMDGVRADRLLNVPHGTTGRALSIKMAGTGEVKEIRADVLLVE